MPIGFCEVTKAHSQNGPHGNAAATHRVRGPGVGRRRGRNTRVVVAVCRSVFQWERVTLTRIEKGKLFTDSEPRQAENIRGQELGNCRPFWCSYNFKVVGCIPIDKCLEKTCTLLAWLVAWLLLWAFGKLGISEQSFDSRISPVLRCWIYTQKKLMMRSCWHSLGNTQPKSPWNVAVYGLLTSMVLNNNK